MNVDGSSTAAPPASVSAKDAMDVDVSRNVSAPDNERSEEISDDEMETVR